MPKIKELQSEECPREKAIKLGFNSLTNVELLAIIIGAGTKGLNAIEISREILKKYGKLSSLVNLNHDNLRSIKGIGLVNSLKIQSALEIGKRLINDLDIKINQKNYCPHFLYLSYFFHFMNIKNEEFLLIQINNAGRILKENVYLSSKSGSLKLNINKLFDDLIGEAKKVILIHNHIDDNAFPSSKDIDLTLTLFKLLKKNNITLLDHLIVSRKNFFSFRSEKILSID